MAQLKIVSLLSPAESMTISSFHRGILQEKVEEFRSLLSERKLQLEEEFRTFKQEHASDSPEILQEEIQTSFDRMKSNQQAELDKLHDVCQHRLDELFQRFQKEWSKDPKEKTVNLVLPRSGPESAYLGTVLGEVLSHGLAELCDKRPIDPIEYLSLWLRKHAENMTLERENAVCAFKLRMVQEENVLIKETQELMVRERQHIKDEAKRRKKLFMEQSNQVIDEPDHPAQRAGNDDTQEADTPSGGAPKRVTVVEPDNANSLYTIEEKDTEGSTENEIVESEK